jgi:hypothetical protein
MTEDDVRRIVREEMAAAAPIALAGTGISLEQAVLLMRRNNEELVRLISPRGPDEPLGELA